MNRLREALKNGEFVITCEFVPGRGKEGPSVEAALEFAGETAGLGMKVHAVSLTDNPGGNPAITPDALAPEIQRRGLDALVHFSCRDLNRNAMESRLMGLSRLGIHNLLIVTGDLPVSGYGGKAAGVFDLDSVQAIRFAKALNAGFQVPGGRKGTMITLPRTDFFVGAAVTPFKYTENELMPQYFKMERKIEAGADFIVSQLGYDMRKCLEILRYLRSRGLQTPVIGNVYVLSHGAARAMHGGAVPGCVVTDELLRLTEVESREPDKGRHRRLERAARMVAMFKGMGFGGVHIGGFSLKTADFRFILQRADELEARWEEFIPEVSFGPEGGYYAFPLPHSYRPGKPETDPVIPIARTRKPFMYAFALVMHWLMFRRRSPGCRLMTRYYKLIGDKAVPARLSHLVEYLGKKLLFRCKDCGDCALADMAYCCPQGTCAKRQRNGPCGGSRDGRCEAFPAVKRCAWATVYDRMKSSGRLDELRGGGVPPRKTELENTSAWFNYFTGKDHHAD